MSFHIDKNLKTDYLAQVSYLFSLLSVAELCDERNSVRKKTTSADEAVHG